MTKVGMVLVLLAILLGSCSNSGEEEALAPVKTAGEEALARVRIGDDNSGKWGYINPKGDFVINPQFDYAESFSK